MSGILGVELSGVTSGAVVNESLETSIPGVFSCGNVLHVHDLVDYVSQEASQAGKYAVKFLAGGDDKSEASIKVVTDGGVRYSVPQILRPDSMEELTTVRFRVGNIFKDVDVVAYAGEREIGRYHKRVMAPGEMEQVIIKKSDLLAEGIPSVYRLTIESK